MARGPDPQLGKKRYFLLEEEDAVRLPSQRVPLFLHETSGVVCMERSTQNLGAES